MVHLSERELQLPDHVIAQMLKLAAEGKDIISLGPGEPDFITPQPILNYAAQLMKSGKGTHYAPPGGRSDLKEVIIKKLKKDNKISAMPENIVVCCGSQEALFLALANSIDVSEQVLVQNPGFMGYIPAIEMLNGFPVSVPLFEEEDFEINPDRVRKLIDKKKTKVLILNSPANPTGNVISKKILEEIADIAVEYDIYVFSDEAYEKLVYDKKHISFASLNGMKKYAVTFQTFSKSFAMCGFRVGYAVAPKELAQAMTKTHVYTTLSAPNIGQMVAKKALEISPKYTEAMRREYDRRRKYIVKRLNEIGLKTIEPNGAFYAFSNIKHLSNNSYDFTMKLLRKAHVTAIPGTEFGKYGEGYVRFSYATDYNLIVKAMNKLEKFVK